MNDLKHFAYEHLPLHLGQVSGEVHDLAEIMLRDLPACEERCIGLRKLLEAKDCFVRARLERSPDWAPEDE